MDSSIPERAAALLDLIGNTEAPRGYDTLFGNNQAKLPKPLTSMTLSEVIAAGPGWSFSFGSSASGRYQFLTATLKTLRALDGLSGSERFEPDLQDRLAFTLLDQRGYERFAGGKISRIEFALGLAKEWASFPVLVKCQGAHRIVDRGETYYAGDQLNRALITPERVEQILGDQALAAPQVAAARLAPAARLAAAAPASAGDIEKLIALGKDPASIASIQAAAKQAMADAGYGLTLHNACAATLSLFLQGAGFTIPLTLGAGNLADRLKARGWARIEVGTQDAGDVGVAFDRTPPAGADHIYLVVERKDGDEMVIADNQDPSPHTRFASGKGKTPTEYFLRVPNGAAIAQAAHVDGVDPGGDFPWDDEDSNGLVEPFDDSGLAVSS